MKSLALILATCAALAPAVAVANHAASKRSNPEAALPHKRAMPHKSNTLAEVKFRFDSAALPADAKALIRPAISYAAAHRSTRIVVDAHCDPVGTSPYNAALAVRRAESVKRQLVAAGVPDDQIVLSIYGEDGRRRAHYTDDRRVTLWWTREPIAEVTREALAARSTAVTWGRPMTTAQLEAAPEPVASR
jgi:peptidoglycan-associated lipoprotein